jgi:IS30 family transposase
MRRPYAQLSLDERRKIERWRHAGVAATVIAEKLGRHRSTIFRELHRNSFIDRELPELGGLLRYRCPRPSS